MVAIYDFGTGFRLFLVIKLQGSSTRNDVNTAKKSINFTLCPYNYRDCTAIVVYRRRALKLWIFFLVFDFQ